MRRKYIWLAVVAGHLLALGALLAVVSAQGLPTFPNSFNGKAFVAGQPAPDGLEIFARVGDYQSNTPLPGSDPAKRSMVLVTNGAYNALTVSPPDENVFGKTITFHATLGFGDVQATETATFVIGIQVLFDFDLNFPSMPTGPPTPTPPPTATPPPTPTTTPVLPIPGDPAVPQLSRLALVGGGVALVAGIAVLLVARRRRAY